MTRPRIQSIARSRPPVEADGDGRALDGTDVGYAASMRLRKVLPVLWVVFVVACGGGPGASVRAPTPPVSAPAEDAEAIHRAAIVIDTHDDVTQRMVVEGVDLAKRLADGQTDLPRMR